MRRALVLVILALLVLPFALAERNTQDYPRPVGIMFYELADGTIFAGNAMGYSQGNVQAVRNVPLDPGTVRFAKGWGATCEIKGGITVTYKAGDKYRAYGQERSYKVLLCKSTAFRQLVYPIRIVPVPNTGGQPDWTHEYRAADDPWKYPLYDTKGYGIKNGQLDLAANSPIQVKPGDVGNVLDANILKSLYYEVEDKCVRNIISDDQLYAVIPDKKDVEECYEKFTVITSGAQVDYDILDATETELTIQSLTIETRFQNADKQEMIVKGATYIIKIENQKRTSRINGFYDFKKQTDGTFLLEPRGESDGRKKLSLTSKEGEEMEICGQRFNGPVLQEQIEECQTTSETCDTWRIAEKDECTTDPHGLWIVNENTIDGKSEDRYIRVFCISETPVTPTTPETPQPIVEEPIYAGAPATWTSSASNSPQCNEGEECTTTLTFTITPGAEGKIPEYCVMGVLPWKGSEPYTGKVGDKEELLRWLIKCEKLKGGLTIPDVKITDPKTTSRIYLFPLVDTRVQDSLKDEEKSDTEASTQYEEDKAAVEKAANERASTKFLFTHLSNSDVFFETAPRGYSGALDVKAREATGEAGGGKPPGGAPPADKTQAETKIKIEDVSTNQKIGEMPFYIIKMDMKTLDQVSKDAFASMTHRPLLLKTNAAKTLMNPGDKNLYCISAKENVEKYAEECAAILIFPEEIATAELAVSLTEEESRKTAWIKMEGAESVVIHAWSPRPEQPKMSLTAGFWQMFDVGNSCEFDFGYNSIDEENNPLPDRFCVSADTSAREYVSNPAMQVSEKEKLLQPSEVLIKDENHDACSDELENDIDEREGELTYTFWEDKLETGAVGYAHLWVNVMESPKRGQFYYETLGIDQGGDSNIEDNMNVADEAEAALLVFFKQRESYEQIVVTNHDDDETSTHNANAFKINYDKDKQKWSFRYRYNFAHQTLSDQDVPYDQTVTYVGYEGGEDFALLLSPSDDWWVNERSDNDERTNALKQFGNTKHALIIVDTAESGVNDDVTGTLVDTHVIASNQLTGNFLSFSTTYGATTIIESKKPDDDLRDMQADYSGQKDFTPQTALENDPLYIVEKDGEYELVADYSKWFWADIDKVTFQKRTDLEGYDEAYMIADGPGFVDEYRRYAWIGSGNFTLADNMGTGIRIESREGVKDPRRERLKSMEDSGYTNKFQDSDCVWTLADNDKYAKVEDCSQNRLGDCKACSLTEDACICGEREEDQTNT